MVRGRDPRRSVLFLSSQCSAREASPKSTGPSLDQTGSTASRCNRHHHRRIHRTGPDGCHQRGRPLRHRRRSRPAGTRSGQSFRAFRRRHRPESLSLVGQAVTLSFALPVGGLQDQITVTGEAPIIEVTQTQIGANITAQQIDDLPTQGRQQYALLALVPGMTPNLAPGAFEGSQYSANGRETGGNLFMVDGMYNNDDRTLAGTGSQTRMTIDTTSEYQVLVHEYGAEYGGSTGAIVNAVTKSGTNAIHGRGAFYLQDSSLDATNYFVKKNGLDKAGQRYQDDARQHRRTNSEEQGILLFQYRAPSDPTGGQPELSGRGSAAGELVLHHPSHQIHQHLSARGLRAERVEQVQFPRAVRPERGGRSGSRTGQTDNLGDENRTRAEAGRVLLEHPVAWRAGKPHGERGAGVPRARESPRRRSGALRRGWRQGVGAQRGWRG